MSFFNNVLYNAKRAAGVATRKTGDAVELSKLRLRAMQLNSQIQSTFERMGTMTYEQQKNQIDNSGQIEACVAEIDSLKKTLENIENSMKQLREGVKCPECGEGNEPNQKYCKGCGKNLKTRLM